MGIFQKLEKTTIANTIFVLLGLNLVLQVLIIMGFLPASMVWGGRLESFDQLLLAFVMGMGVMFLIGLVVAFKTGYIKHRIPEKIVNALLWVCGFFFLLNTLGNLASASILESIIFTPITIVLAASFFALSFKKNSVQGKK
ncbi:MAG: hypothetical protein MRZ79_03175 [Bacteroidia bacterium]|nr:hypothetical protein [Bacteroidia bacterium]